MQDERDGLTRIADERRRQIEVEGYAPEHDAAHNNQALAYAAAVYAAPELIFHMQHDQRPYPDVQGGRMTWHEPWPMHWKRPARAVVPVERIRELEKAGALIAAEIDRLLMTGEVDG